MGNIPAPQCVEIIKYITSQHKWKTTLEIAGNSCSKKTPNTTHGVFQWKNCKFPRKFSWILTFVRSHWVNQCIIDQPAVMNLFFFLSFTVYTYIVSDTSSWDLHSFPSSSSEKEAWVGPQIPQVFSLLSRNKWTLRKRKQLPYCSADFKLAPALGYVGSVTCMYSYVSSQRHGKVKLIKV